MDKESASYAAQVAQVAASTASAAAEKAATTAKDAAVAAAVVGNNVERIQRDISEINVTLKTLDGKFVHANEFVTHLKADEDHEKRLRVLEEREDQIAVMVSDIALIKRLVYGCVGLILSAVVVSLIYLVVQK